MNIAFYTLGCKVNQYDTMVLETKFKKLNYNIVNTSEIADIYVINSCTVTSVADRKTKQIINRLKRLNKNSIIALIGCYPQASKNNLFNLDNVDIILGSNNKFELPYHIENFIKNKNKIIKVNNYSSDYSLEFTNNFFDKTRALLKIEDGCDKFCSYCIIPKARGKVVSKSLNQIKREIEIIDKNGFKEVVLVGVNLSSYGNDIDDNLIDVLEFIDNESDIKRIRLGSLEPDILDCDFINKLSKIKSFVPHFHLSMQSGSDKILKLMNRHYTTQECLNSIKLIKNLFENPTFTCDIIVGFPSETETDFDKTINFVKDVGFIKVHVFPYSERKGTKATFLEEKIPQNIKKDRVKKLTQISDIIKDTLYNEQIGKIYNVLFEKYNNKYLIGYTDNYLQVKVYSDKNLSKQVKCVKIIDKDSEYCIGEINE